MVNTHTASAGSTLGAQAIQHTALTFAPLLKQITNIYYCCCCCVQGRCQTPGCYATEISRDSTQIFRVVLPRPPTVETSRKEIPFSPFHSWKLERLECPNSSLQSCLLPITFSVMESFSIYHPNFSSLEYPLSSDLSQFPFWHSTFTMISD